MTLPVPVLCADGGYAAAVAELPLRTRRTRDAAGAVVVLSGSADWRDGVRRAAAAGARAVVVSHPRVMAAAEIRTLAADLGDMPVVMQRRLFRSDAATDAASARDSVDAGTPRLVAVDGAAPAADHEVVLRDAAAWARVLAGGALDWYAASGGLALSNGFSADAAPAVLNVVAVDRGSPWIRAHALSGTRSHVEASVEQIVVSTVGDHGRLVASSRYETPQRLALRRALGAVEGRHSVADLAELAADAELAQQLTGGRPL